MSYNRDDTRLIVLSAVFVWSPLFDAMLICYLKTQGNTNAAPEPNLRLDLSTWISDVYTVLSHIQTSSFDLITAEKPGTRLTWL